MAPENKTKSNIFLFFGDDDFSLKRKLEIWKTEFAKKFTAQAVSLLDASTLAESDLIRTIKDQFAPSLFASRKLIIIRDALPTKSSQTTLADFVLSLSVPQDFIVVFWQTHRLDGRLGFTKKFLAGPITVNEFTLPHGASLDAWIKAMASNLQAEITDPAATLLAQYLGRDLFEEKKAGGRVIERREAFDLWQAHSELSKLAASSATITPELVRALVRPKLPESVFSLTDELVAKRPAGALKSLENYLAASAGDEKSALIKVLGLLTEQFRSLLLVSLLEKENLGSSEMAEKLGYTPGRVFILSKHAKVFSIAQLKRFLSRLLLIDLKLKTSDAGGHLLLDLFIAEASS